MSEQRQPYTISRRRLLKGTAGMAGLTAMSGLLGACAVAPAAAPGSGAAAEQPMTDVYVITLGAFADMSTRDSTALYNEEAAERGIRYILEDTAEGWEPKALAMVRENDMRWSAHGIANAGNQWNYIQMGLVQPLDDLLQSSTVPWAKDLADHYYYPAIHEATLYEGKSYFVPMKLNIHLMGYRQDYIEAAGYEEIPETWDEFEVMLEKMKEALEPEGVVPFAVRKEVFRTIGTAFTTFVENPYDDNNMLRIDSEEWLNCIKMFKRWFDKGLTNLELLQDPMPDWQTGKTAIGIDSHSWVRIGRSVWGADLVNGTVPPKTDKSNPKRTWIHLDSGFVFTGAPHPQEGLDWLLATMGPEGAPADRHWSGTLTFSGMPVHTTQYEKLIGSSDAYPELVDAYAAIPTSTLQPMEAGRYYPIIQSKIWPWLERYWGGEIEAEEAMENTIQEVEEELAKQQA
ncbi:MAG: extracellular solute-binding protein [Caldilineaceae bacterium]|nr:extracellular solute-binding protein [Caldilineaceae bacterium]